MNTLYMTLMRLNALQNTASDRLALVEAVDSAYKSVTTASDAELDAVPPQAHAEELSFEEEAEQEREEPADGQVGDERADLLDQLAENGAAFAAGYLVAKLTRSKD